MIDRITSGRSISPGVSAEFDNIADPIGHPIQAYRDCIAQINAVLALLIH